MKLFCKKGTFDFQDGYSFTITLFNQLLTDQGDRSTPITLPATPNNLRLIGYANRIDAYNKPKTEIKTIFQNGSWSVRTMLIIHQATHKTIDATLYFNRGTFYSLTDEKKLSDINLNTIEAPQEIENSQEREDYLINLLRAEYFTPNPDSPYCVAQVLTSETNDQQLYDQGGTVEHITDRPFILNGHVENSRTWHDKNNNITKFSTLEGEYARKIEDGNTPIRIEKGYGMTPFLKLSYVLKKLFWQYGGYQLNLSVLGNLLDSNNSGGGWVVLVNNVADAIYTGELNLSQLLPDIEIKEFLKKIEMTYVGKFIINDITRTATFLSYNFALTNTPKKDLTAVLASEPTISAVEFTKYRVAFTDETLGTADKNTVDINIPIAKMGTVSVKSKLLINGGVVADDFSYPLKTVMVDNSVRKNTTVVINNTPEEVKNKNTNTEMILGRVKKEMTTVQVALSPSVTGGYLHRPVDEVFVTHVELGTLKAMIKEYYAPYISLHKNSYLSVKATARMTQSELLNIDFQDQYLINGNAYFIEKIECEVPFSGIQELTLRTTREYIDR